VKRIPDDKLPPEAENGDEDEEEDFLPPNAANPKPRSGSDKKGEEGKERR
jgi:hypothetical protein